MEDLWGSPWAADSATKLDDFPAAPQTVHFPVQQHQQQHQHHHALPRKISQNLSPWNDEGSNNDDDHHSNAWGGSEGWNHNLYNGGQKGASAWRRSPALKPLDAFPGLQREPSPDPWKAVEVDRSAAKTADGPRLRSGSQRSSRRKEEGRIEAAEKPPQDDASAHEILIAEPGLKLDLEKQDAWSADEEPESGPGSLGHSSISGETFSGPESDSDRALDQDMEKPPAEAEAEPATNPPPDTSPIHEDGDEVEPAVIEDHQPQPVQPSMLFPIDFAALDALFPTTGPIDTKPEPIPDVIIDNTFTTTGERKTWYRISRYGSSRKHDSGEDDNYHRVSWSGSEVRGRTLKTVRRWMEEDAAHGGSRILMGGRVGASGASMFNWDSKAPPVEISQLLSLSKQVRKAGHGRHASVMNPVPTPEPSAPAKKRPVSMIQLGNGSPPVPQSIKSPPPIEPLSPFKMAPGLPSMHSPRTTSPIRPSNLKTVKLADDPDTESEKEGEDEDDDDEWGEMVGTPTVEADHATPFELPLTATPPMTPLSNPVSNTKPIPSKIRTNLNPTTSSTSSPIWDLDCLEDTWGGSVTPAHSFSTGHATPTTPTSRSLGETFSALAQKTLSPFKHSPTAAGKQKQQQQQQQQSPTPVSPVTSLSLEEETDMDALVASILQDLPDLTYMLR